MKSGFFKIAVLGNFLILVFSFSVSFFEKGTIQNDPGVVAVDRLTLNQDYNRDAIDEAASISERALSEAMPFSIIFSSLLLLGFFVALLAPYLSRRSPKIFDRILGTSSMRPKPSGSFVDPGYNPEVAKRFAQQMSDRLRK